MSTYYPPYKSSSNNIKVELDLTNYATKTDLKNITHTDVSSFASKTNLAALKTEVDKIDVDKLKTIEQLSNVVKNEVVKKTDFSADNYVTRTKFSTDTNALDDKIDKVDKKNPDVSNLATKSSVTILLRDLDDRIDKIKIKDYAKKTSLSGYMLTSTFNTKSTELENKIKDADIIAKSAVTKANAIKSDLNDYAKKTDVANDIITIKNDYVTNANLTSRLNDLKSQHIATEVKTIDDKTKKNSSDILALENKLKQKEYVINENERGLSFNRGFFYYMDQSYLVYDCKMGSFNFTTSKICTWKSTGIFNRFSNSTYITSSIMDAVGDAKGNLPDLKNDGRMNVYLSGNHFQQNVASIPNSDNVINIYCVYKLDPIASNRDTAFTIQNALFGVMQITKSTDTSKYNYKGCGICFDEGSQFGHTITEGGFAHTTNARNVLIFGADISVSTNANNRANNIYVTGELFIQGIKILRYMQKKKFYRNFTDPGKKFMLRLHYNGDDSYLFVNGRQELKFKCKTDQLVKEKLCIGNLSDQWTTSESEKTGLCGNIYDFVVIYEQIFGVKAIYDMH